MDDGQGSERCRLQSSSRSYGRVAGMSTRRAFVRGSSGMEKALTETLDGTRRAGSVETLSKDVDHDIERFARFMRNALSDWHAWLAIRSLNWDDWRETPSWARRTVHDLDLNWALEGIRMWYVEKHYYGLLKQRIFNIREWVRTAEPEISEGMPDMERLWQFASVFQEYVDE